jgi:hypothetical protein
MALRDGTEAAARLREAVAARKQATPEDGHNGHKPNTGGKMKRLPIAHAKLNVVFPEGSLPAIDPNKPEFTLVLGKLEIRGKVSAKSARKLGVHKGGAALQGRLVVENGTLCLIEAGFAWIDPKPGPGADGDAAEKSAEALAEPLAADAKKG